MNRRSIGWSAGFWGMTCAGLAAVVAYQLFYSFPLAPTVTAAPPAAPMVEPAAGPAEPRLPGDDAVDEIAARPLFSEGRQPYVAPAASAEEPTSAPARPALPLELAGTYLSGADRAALVQVAGRAPEWLRLGELIDGWRIEVIQQDQVRLRKGDQEQILLLRADLAVEPQRRPVPPRPERQASDEPATADEAPADEDETED
jgi:Type II secretion system protein C